MSPSKTFANPLLQPFKTPFQSVPFDLVKTEHFLPALEKHMQDARDRIETIKANPGPHTFQNSLLALEEATEKATLVSEIFFNLLGAEADEAVQALAKEISPLLARFSNDISLDERLFHHIKSANDSRATLGLSFEEMRILEKTYRDFVRNGANLRPKEKDKLRTIDEELSKLGPQFSENVLKATNAFELILTNPEELDGLPEGVREAAQSFAKSRGKEGYLFTLDAPSYVPFLTYSKRRDLREKLTRANVTRAYKGPFDNSDILKRIAVLRFERAKLLGFKDHAAYVLQERMASELPTVEKFMERILKVARPAAEKELAELKAFAQETDGLSDFQSWDAAYYSEKLKEKKFKFDEEALRPYFKLENVIDGVFEHARKLYGLVFKPRIDIPIYHKDVKVFEVLDESSNRHIGLFYADFFPRPTKRGGAWMTSFREQGLFDGEVRRPHIAIVCNFTRPTESKPSLISFSEVQTLFHEFGHALHGLLSECHYRNLSGTNVYWDFVELPSQIMENWTFEKESLDLYARHFETGELIPAELTVKLKASSTFQAGMFSLRQLGLGLIDLAWHSGDPSLVKDLEAFEDKIVSRTRLLPPIPATSTSAAFSHIFAGGYSAGYYSYKWAEVLDADAFEFFKEKGIFNKEVSDKFREYVLSKGGTLPPMDLYVKFRGREPDPDALLRREGLL